MAIRTVEMLPFTCSIDFLSLGGAAQTLSTVG